MTAKRFSESETRLLAELLAGERRETDLEVARALRASPALRAEYETLRGIAGAAERIGAMVRSDVAVAAAAPAEPTDRALVRAAISRELRAGRTGPRALWLVAAAVVMAAAALVWVVARGGEGGGEAGEVILGPAPDHGLRPSGPGSDFAVFRWRTEPDGGYFRVRVYAADPAGSRGPLLVTSGEVESTSWNPPDEERRLLERHGRIYWDLVFTDASGLEREVGSALAWR